jgi:hypothetical protein
MHLVRRAVDGEDASVLVSVQAPVTRIVVSMGWIKLAMAADAAELELGGGRDGEIPDGKRVRWHGVKLPPVDDETPLQIFADNVPDR